MILNDFITIPKPIDRIAPHYTAEYSGEVKLSSIIGIVNWRENSNWEKLLKRLNYGQWHGSKDTFRAKLIVSLLHNDRIVIRLTLAYTIGIKKQ